MKPSSCRYCGSAPCPCSNVAGRLPDPRTIGGAARWTYQSKRHVAINVTEACLEACRPHPWTAAHVVLALAARKGPLRMITLWTDGGDFMTIGPLP